MTSPRFSGKTAIVTGAATGIGYAIAKELATEGATVILNDLDAEKAELAANEISASAEGRCLPFAGDSSHVDLIQKMVKFAVVETGKLDLCVANAGITLFSNFLDCTPDDFRKVVDLNLQGSFFLTQEATRQMQAQGTGGRILLMSSVAGVQACPNLSIYAMTKAALSMMARSLVTELAPIGIGINAVAPGATLTERTSMEETDYEGTWAKLTPDKKPARAEDVAEAATFLLSDAAAHINGQTLIVDGGWTATSPYPHAVN